MGADDMTDVAAQVTRTHSAPSSASAPQASPHGSLQFRPAASLTEVIRAWGLVYTAYRRIGLIDANPWRLHCVPQAARRGTLVVNGWLAGDVTSTLTTMLDGPDGLPLDKVYPTELGRLRAAGHRLLEVGLLADRREHMARSAASLLELMCYPIFESLRTHHNLIIIGVHPHHAPFYQRMYGLAQFGPESVHPTVKDHAVVPMMLDVPARLRDTALPRGLARCVARPLADNAFAARYDFPPEEISASAIGEFLRFRYARAAAGAAASGREAGGPV